MRECISAPSVYKEVIMTDELKQWEYDKGYSAGRASLIKELEKIKAEIEDLTLYRSNDIWGNTYPVYDQKEVLAILDKHIKENKQ